ncbi:MAG: fumarate hydratase [Candidatus Gastranaerophilales bacterium]|nr:fumarate hydratase [Candidatus Gastranaerophilales bacterium]
MNIIKTSTLQKIIKDLCITANTALGKEVYNALLALYKNETNKNAKNTLLQILQNAKIAKDTNRPLCQDTGIVSVFLHIGKNIIFEDDLEKVINEAVAAAYTENFYRKSIVSDAVFDRINTKTNTPIVIYTIHDYSDELKISVMVKGAGSENMNALCMLSPAKGKDGIVEFVADTIQKAGSQPCPPIRLGIGIGGTSEKAMILSKLALLEPLQSKAKEPFKSLEREILSKVNASNIGAMGLGGNSTCFGVNILSVPCHMASLPVAISVNCHSARHAAAVIKDDSVSYLHEDFEAENLPDLSAKDFVSVNLQDTEAVKNLKAGQNVLLSGTVYTARDAAHKKILEMMDKGEELPFELKNAVIFYAGPAPCAPGEITGPIGPTTSSRMDKYAPVFYGKGVLATIGKGGRSEEAAAAIKANGGVYFTVTGGAACLLQKCITKSEVIAFEDLGAEAVFKLELKDFPALTDLK